MNQMASPGYVYFQDSGVMIDKSGLQYLFCQVTVLNAANYQYVLSGVH